MQFPGDAADIGPSPRAWGQRGPPPFRDVHRRSIPTGVGTTSRRIGITRSGTVHPHGRGDNVTGDDPDAGRRGPSPRAWGQPPPPRPRPANPRSIPTGVGTTRGRGSRTGRFAVHPHGRGDNRRLWSRGRWGCGPSPRAWGQPLARLRHPRIVRSIPTGVGTTREHHDLTATAPVHPHGRGDNAWIQDRVDSGLGPSPRAWGQRQHQT